ncbi:putative transcription regulator IWS1 family [Helianthus anomalus]
MYGRWEGELWFHRWHMWPVPSSSTPSVAAQNNSFVFDGRKINVGDCALFKPSYNSLPFVGRIRKLKLGKENNLSLCVNWLYRPADVKLKDGAPLEAAPNEVFYSFHKDEIPAASLLHPCKVTFLRKGVEFPAGISSFVCRRVYDIEGECLWWLTDKNYINSFLTQKLQEEVDQLLDKTSIEMHGAVQTGGRSPKPINGPNGSAQLKPSSDNVQNSSSSISSHAKSKKREHGAHNSESVKRDRLSKVDDADSGQLRPERVLKSEIAKITDKGGLLDFSGVEKLIQLMRPDSTEKKLNLACRRMLVDVISCTDRFDYLGRFVQLRGLSVLDEWLQEIHKCKIGDGSPKENEKSVEDFLFSLLRALDRLPVNLHALQMCNVGKSVNHLRSHKNSEIQKKARSLVSTWKRRVEAEMNIIETKSSTSRGGSWPNKSMISEVSHVGPKGSTSQPSVIKSQRPKQSSGEVVVKSPTSLGSTKMSPSSSQSPNNSQSCSSDHGKTGTSSVSKISSSVSHSKNSSNGFHASTIAGVQKGSPTKHTSERVSDVSLVDNGSNPRLIVRLPNTSRSPVQTASVESPGDSSTVSGKGSVPVPSEKQDLKVSRKIDSVSNVQNTNTAKEGLAVCDEEHGKKDASFGSGSSSGITPKPGKLYEPSYSSINALVESCAKFSEASVPPSGGDVGGINLLASVAAGEMTRSDVSPACSPGSNSPVREDSSSVNVAKLRQTANDVGHSEDNISVANGSVGGDNSTQLVNMDTDVKPAGLIEDASVDATNMKPNSLSSLQEDKCVDDKPVKRTMGLGPGPPDAAAATVKTETQINEESASWSSSDMHADEKKLVLKRSTDDVDLAPKFEENDDNKADHSSRQNMDSGTSECAHENMENDGKNPVSEKSNDVTEPEPSCVEDHTVKLDFDLNEVLPSDDGVQGEAEKAALHTPSPLPSNNKNRSGLITVAAAAKGPFYPSESLSRGKPELGWKGSAATSAFRPAEPRKVDVPVPDNRTTKPVRPLFDFDLNVGAEDAGQSNAPSGLDLDLNASEEGPEVVQLSISRPRSFLPGGPNSSRDFDLNGPGVEEVGGESVSFSKNGMQFMSGISNVRMNNMDIGSYSTWFPPNNTYPAMTIPSQRMLAPVASTSVNPEMFRGPVLSSSPAVAFSSGVPFQYSAFPFETNFSIPSMSNTFSSVSNAYVDSSSSGGGPICFPTIPSVGPNGVVSMPYRPYFMSLPGGGSSNVGPDGRKWVSQGQGQGLDLNAGPGGGSDDKLPFALRQLPLAGSQAVPDEQLKMFQQMAAGSGGAPKRKEPDGGWDSDRISYKHPHWQ